MKIEKTTTDGWDCVPELQKATTILEDIDHHLYEIKHCVRKTELPELVSEITDALKEAIEKLNEIDVYVEHVTIHEDE